MFLIVAMLRLADTDTILHPQRSQFVLATTEIVYSYTDPTIQWIKFILMWPLQACFDIWLEIFGSFITLILGYTFLYCWSIVGFLIIDFKYLTKYFVVLMIKGNRSILEILKNPARHDDYMYTEDYQWHKTRKSRDTYIREFGFE